MINNQSNEKFTVRAIVSSVLVIALIVGIVFVGNVFNDNDVYDDMQITTDRLDFTEPATKFDFDFSAGNVKVLTTTSTPYIEIRGDKYSAIAHRYNDGKYTVETTSTRRDLAHFLDRAFRGSFSVNVDVYLPQEMLDEVTINVSAGKVSVDGIATKKAKFDVSAGEVNIENSTIKNLKTELSAGNLDIAVLADIESIDASVSAGTMDLNLPNNIGSFDLYYEKSAGSINDKSEFGLDETIKNSAFSSGGKCSYRNGDGEVIQINLDVSAGSIKIDDYN